VTGIAFLRKLFVPMEMTAAPADTVRMSTEDTNGTESDGAPVRRRGDRRVQDNVVPDDRRKGDRRDTPGIGALIQTLFRRGPSSNS
jgi:hypothetical protein